MFPQVDRRTVLWNLQRDGNNVASTTERILAGRMETVSSYITTSPALFLGSILFTDADIYLLVAPDNLPASAPAGLSRCDIIHVTRTDAIEAGREAGPAGPNHEVQPTGQGHQRVLERGGARAREEGMELEQGRETSDAAEKER